MTGTLEVAERDLLSRLAGHRALGGAPAEEHAWLAQHGTLHTYQVGEVVTAKGEQARNMLVVLDGHLVLRADRGAGTHKVIEWRGGDVGGVLPYSRGASPPNDVVAEERTDALQIGKELLAELARSCPVVTATLVHAMVDRARQFTSSELRDEKLISLGKLAAGLAHELNNPASAAVRSARSLAEAAAAAETAARQLAEAHLSSEQFAAIDAVAGAGPGAPVSVPLSAMDRADREDEIADWLDDHDLGEDAAGTLADMGVTVETLDALADVVAGDALGASLAWLSSWSVMQRLASEIETAATRIHDLVDAVKGFAYMDHAPAPEPVDLRRGMTDTLMMLGAKTRAKSVAVTIDLAEGLPPARGVGAELNQIWMNLIDNALDAVAPGGRVTVTGRHELDSVVVRVVDDGAGIPEEIRARIFDPFFTTKGVGKGTGLGLDAVRRIVQRHEGAVAVDSRPGRTEFEVRLPAAT